MCISRRYSYWPVYVTPLLQSHALDQNQQVKGEGYCAVPLSTKAAFMPTKLYFCHLVYVLMQLLLFSFTQNPNMAPGDGSS